MFAAVLMRTVAVRHAMGLAADLSDSGDSVYVRRRSRLGTFVSHHGSDGPTDLLLWHNADPGFEQRERMFLSSGTLSQTDETDQPGHSACLGSQSIRRRPDPARSRPAFHRHLLRNAFALPPQSVSQPAGGVSERPLRAECLLLMV